jgi:hypothetical protein
MIWSDWVLSLLSTSRWVVHFPLAAPLVDATAGWTAWNIAYRYPDIVPPQPGPSIEELARALGLISCLAKMLRSLGSP